MISWLHISDTHLKAGDQYDTHVVLSALVQSVRRVREADGPTPHIVFFTGDVAFSGQPAEYEAATEFFDALLDALELGRERLFIIPGNHDVYRPGTIGLARTLTSREEADAYFSPTAPCLHLTQGQRPFLDWYKTYFGNVREPPSTSCGPVESVVVQDVRVGVLPINSALFCRGDDDHERLWIGRRALEQAISEMQAIDADVKVALIHHPLHWLAEAEHSQIHTKLTESVDVILRGHLHKTAIEQITTPAGGAVHMAAGATYQTRLRPQSAMFVEYEETSLRVRPIRYEDDPAEMWVADPTLFPESLDNSGSVPLSAPTTGGQNYALTTAAATERLPVGHVRQVGAFRSNVLSRRGLPVVGRESELDTVAELLGDSANDGVAVLVGPPGVGKTELALEYARRNRGRYPGGTFVVDASVSDAPVELARVGSNYLGLNFPATASLDDQCERTLVALGANSTLLIYDNVQSLRGIERWLPGSGTACHVLITTLGDRSETVWKTLLIRPLDDERSIELVEKLAGPDIAKAHGAALARHCDGLPVELCPVAILLGSEHRRGRDTDPEVAELVSETQSSFSLALGRLDAEARMVLTGASSLNPRRIERDELAKQMKLAFGWSTNQFEAALDACLDLRLLEGDRLLKMHQLFAEFMRSSSIASEQDASVIKVRSGQWGRLVEMANAVLERPGDAALTASLTSFDLSPATWSTSKPTVLEEMLIGRALLEVGQCELSRPWFERAIERIRTESDAESGLTEEVPPELLNMCVYAIGRCYSGAGQFETARPWYERALEGLDQQDGNPDHSALRKGLHMVGYCHASVGNFIEARSWYERAVEEARKTKPDELDHDGLGGSLNSVGDCYFRSQEYDRARPWHEDAAHEIRQGDPLGRIDHELLSKSYHSVGVCHSAARQYDEARKWYERAVAEGRQGDIHGRVDHASVGMSLHQIAICYMRVNRDAQALSWCEQAVAEKRRGNVYGQIDHTSISKSIYGIAVIHSQKQSLNGVRPLCEEAITEAREGNIHGRVDHDRVSDCLLLLARCCATSDAVEEALSCYEEAINEKRLGDVHGRLDSSGLSSLLRENARYLATVGQVELASEREAEADTVAP
jgi:tetratricopeptide (TPR) repeat protein/predicted phosphodiesterase